jgi:hypothetical protein
MSIKYFEIGVAFESPRDLGYYYMHNEIENSKINFDGDYKLYLSLEEFQRSLKCDYRTDIMHHFFYYNIRVRNIYNNTYVLSYKYINHYSTVFSPRPYRDRSKKWKIGWKFSKSRRLYKYKEDYNTVSRYIDLEKSIGEMIDKYYKGANIIFRKDMDYY